MIGTVEQSSSEDEYVMDVVVSPSFMKFGMFLGIHDTLHVDIIL
jgi:hypothetical protein